MGLVGGLFAASSAVNAVGSAASSYQQSQAIKAQGNYQKNQLQFNAQVAELQATDAINRGNKEASTKKRQTKQIIGSQRAALAAQGIEVNEDTASLIQQDTAGLGAEDVQTIKNNAWREAWGYRVQALDYNSKAGFTSVASRFNSNQTLLTGGLQFARDVSGGAMSWAQNGDSLKSAWANRK